MSDFCYDPHILVSLNAMASSTQTIFPVYDYQEPPSTPPDNTTDPDAIYLPGACFNLYAVTPPPIPNGDQWCQHDAHSLQRQKVEGLFALSLTNRIPVPPSSSLSTTLSESLCGGVRDHVTHVWTASSSSTTSNGSETVVAKFYDPLYFHDEYDSVDPLRLVAWSVASEVKAYEMLQSLQGICIPRCLGLYATAITEQDGRTVYVLLLECVAGADLRYLCEDGHRDEIVADFLCQRHREAIFATLVQLTMDFLNLGVLQDDLAPRNIIIRPLAHPGPFCADERCPARFRIDVDDVRAVMVDFERVQIEYPPNPNKISYFQKLFANADIKEYLSRWFRNTHEFPDYRG